MSTTLDSNSTLVDRKALTPGDRLEIQELIARFAHYSDFAAWELIPALFTDDVVTEMEGLPIRYEGVAAQVAHARVSADQTAGKNRHYYFNLFIEQTEDEVTAHYMFVNANAMNKPMEARIVTTGRMSDRVVKTKDGWRICHRFVRFDQAFDLDW